MLKFKEFKQNLESNQLSESYLNILMEAYDIKITDESDLTKITDKEWREYGRLVLQATKEVAKKEGFEFPSHVISFQATPSKEGFKLNIEKEYLETVRARLKELAGKSTKLQTGAGYAGASTARKLPQGMTGTLFFETFQSLGYFINKLDWKEIRKAADKYEKEIPTKKSAFDFIEMSPGLQQEALGLAKASMEHKASLGIKPVDIIWKSIDSYYVALRAKEGIVDYVKDNTADAVIITKGSAKSLMTAIGSNKSTISYDENTGIIKTGKVEFIQISMKAAQDGARLGRITTAINNMVGDFTDKGKVDYKSIISESIFGAIKNSVLSMYDKVKTALNNLFKSFHKKFSKKNVESEMNKIYKDLSKGNKLYESKDMDFKSLGTSINKYIGELQSKYGNTPGVDLKIITSTLDAPKDQSSKNLLIVNKVTVVYLNRMLKTIAGDIKTINDNINELISTMMKGATDLPVTVLYGDGSKPKVVLSHDNNASNIELSIPPIVIHIWPETKKQFYVTTMYILAKVNESDPELSEYIKIQFTNSGGASTVSFKVEGQAANFKYKDIKS